MSERKRTILRKHWTSFQHAKGHSYLRFSRRMSHTWLSNTSLYNHVRVLEIVFCANNWTSESFFITKTIVVMGMHLYGQIGHIRLYEWIKPIDTHCEGYSFYAIVLWSYEMKFSDKKIRSYSWERKVQTLYVPPTAVKYPHSITAIKLQRILLKGKMNLEKFI